MHDHHTERTHPISRTDIDSDWIIHEGEYDGKPQHEVYLDEYSIYKYPVTVAQYRQFCQSTSRAMPEAPSWGWPGHDSHPIVKVTWEDAYAYAQWAGVCLPTEAQWEKAARGTDGRLYPWGNEWDASRCNNYCSTSRLEKTSRVVSFPSGASPYGALDMAGNVFEWCANWYDGIYYQHSPACNPSGLEAGSERVVRGGSWISQSPQHLLVTFRFWHLPLRTSNRHGFRCVLPSSRC